MDISRFLISTKKLIQHSRQHALRSKLIKAVFVHLYWLYYKIFKSSRQFTFQKERYHYFYHPYGHTYLAERAVEIPIIEKIVRQYSGKNILEVGNVFSHYFKVNHDVVDRYEKADGVINQDVVNFKPNKRYDLIISISTLEHVGWDEGPQESKKILSVMKNLKRLLAPKGKIIVTLPLGYNSEFDKLLKTNRLGLTKKFYLERAAKDTWKEANWSTVRKARYSQPFLCANALVIGIFEKS